MAQQVSQAVTSIGEDESELEKKALEMTGQHLRIDCDWVVSSIKLTIGEDVGAILVRTPSR